MKKMHTALDNLTQIRGYSSEAHIRPSHLLFGFRLWPNPKDGPSRIGLGRPPPLHTALVQLTVGEAQDIFINLRKNPLKACRTLLRRFVPINRGRQRNHFRTIVVPACCSEEFRDGRAMCRDERRRAGVRWMIAPLAGGAAS